jgi:MoaA/NifB/PqqE/SkfB family radical SAM enzyme
MARPRVLPVSVVIMIIYAKGHGKSIQSILAGANLNRSEGKKMARKQDNLYVRGHKTAPSKVRMECVRSVFRSKKLPALSRGASFKNHFQEKINKTVIVSGYICNNHCKFCNNSGKRVIGDRNTSEIIQAIIGAKEGGASYLEIIGGEPTIRKDIFDIVSFANKLKFNTISITTNGRMFSYKKFASKIIKCGLNSLVFSIHGHNSLLHDSLTQSNGSFKQLLSGLDNLRDIGFNNLGSNTTIVKTNYRYLPEIGGFIYKLGIRNSEFIFVDPTYGGAHDNFLKLVPRISKAAPFIRKCLDIGRQKNVSHWHARYVPLCHFVGYEDQISEIYEKSVFKTQHIAADFINLNVEASRMKVGRIKTDRCRGCIKFSACEGIWREYFSRFGDSELTPIT